MTPRESLRHDVNLALVRLSGFDMNRPLELEISQAVDEWLPTEECGTHPLLVGKTDADEIAHAIALGTDLRSRFNRAQTASRREFAMSCLNRLAEDASHGPKHWAPELGVLRTAIAKAYPNLGSGT